MNQITPIIEELLKFKIRIQLVWNKELNCIGYRIYGFYKSEFVEIRETPDGITCKARYDETDTIESVSDIVGINYHWWKVSKERWEGWDSPDPDWVPLLLKYNWIKETTQKVRRYE